MSDSRESARVGHNSGSTGNANACVVCYRDVEIYSIGLCEHPVCYECSTRMRVLCQQNECPICRQDLPKVVFTRMVKPFRHLRRSNLFDTRYNIYFDSPDIQEKFNTLLAHACSICPDKQQFRNFNGLKDHMRRTHELHYCDLCVDNLKIFSHERRCYTRSNLSQHRRKGDLDDKSHKGHPLCVFCDQRYMDNDELYRHLRRDHLFCHFCDADGLHHYYNSYNDLREHFRNEHYLCEEGTCVEEMFTGVFRTDIDLKAHKACTHGKHLGKAAAKQARTLELEFTLAPRGGGDNRNNRRLPMSGTSGASGNTGSGALQSNCRRSRDQNNRDLLQQPQQQRQQQRHLGQTDYMAVIVSDLGDVAAEIAFDDDDSSTYVRQPDVRSTEEFPSLGNSSPIIPNLGQPRGRGNLTIRGTLKPQALAVTDENFPALGPDSGISSSTGVASSACGSAAGTSGISKTLNLSVYSSNKTDTSSSSSSQRPKSGAPNVSIQVNHKTDGTVTTRVSGPNIRIKPAQRTSMDCDFPALGRSNLANTAPSTISPNVGQWTKVTCVKQPPEQSSKAKKVSPSPFPEYPPRLPSSEDFPSLSKPARSKKQLSIAVLPQQSSWSQQHQQPSSKKSENENKSIADATKGKTKKKKVKQQVISGNNSSSNESTGSRTNNNITNVSDKAKENLSKNNGTKTEAAAPVTRKDNKMELNTKTDESCERKDNNKSSKKDKSSKSKSKNKKEAAAGGATERSSNDNDSAFTPSNSEKQTSQETSARKCSVLNIDSLNSNENVCKLNDDFPALSIGKSVRSASNGQFMTKVTNPPPGFDTATPPPPGFAVKISSDDRIPSDNGSLTFTNSSGESYTILPTRTGKGELEKMYTYVIPPDFERRNRSLIERVTEVLGDQEAIKEFRFLSGSFRRGDCNPEDYYKRCRRAIGVATFDNLFPEMLVLLPDIEKQQQLFQIHRREVNGQIRLLDACDVCGQIVNVGSDQKAHLSSHTMENDFPALGDTSNTAPPPTTWVVRKV
ncbi:E3 ubiquitin-protein ligase ZNF598 isoform X2 [Venturia canescens]|nr:E3 ubiquitin-protein ligase ZNF598 isoform X2 [Venturia canescens]XP_043279716.1 E3 ubiquitin-protein ligase ZNF598 isoform X2 [Venturia canescens]XP_043279717.1 E3 ubiquitin-protein ligase ZNF598 isoform X2 [Venturia canescens]XP_043279718.1 E3 ubiquitin-protein ligase ZNF598 isoform X2 [Venturia canescens]